MVSIKDEMKGTGQWKIKGKILTLYFFLKIYFEIRKGEFLKEKNTIVW